MDGDPKFTIFWLTGNREIVSGRTIAEAMTLAGYSGGAVRAVDFYGEGERRMARALNYLIGQTRYAARKWDLTDLAVMRVLDRLRHAETGDTLIKTCSTPQAIKRKP